MGSFPAIYHAEDLNKDVKGVSPLDYNHTHFILVDDGSEKKFGREIGLRTSLERDISQLAAIKAGRDTDKSKWRIANKKSAVNILNNGTL